MNDFAMANSMLQSESDRLERQVMRLSAVEERFNEIVGREQVDVARARSLVRKNGQIQTEMKVRINVLVYISLFIKQSVSFSRNAFIFHLDG